MELIKDIGWISVKDRLPAVFTSELCPYWISQDILMADDEGEMVIGNYITFKNGSSPGWSPHGDDIVNTNKIVYWMPIPTLPKPKQI